MNFMKCNEALNGIKKAYGEIAKDVGENKLKYGGIAAGAAVVGAGVGAVGTGMYVASNVASGVKNFLFDR